MLGLDKSGNSAAPSPFLPSQNPSKTHVKHDCLQCSSSLPGPSSRLAFPKSSMLPFHSLSRTYATSTIRPSRLRNKPPLSLDHFLIRQRVLALYRTIVRACYRIPSPIREEMREYARAEFERQKEVEDLRKIRYLLGTGKAEFDRLMGQISIKT